MDGSSLFDDRVDAGRRLAERLDEYRDDPLALVLALPRGGVPVAWEVAAHLGAPLDVLIVRKLGLPGNEELAIGAIASGGVTVLNEDVVDALAVPPGVVEAVAGRERDELERRERLYRGERPPPEVAGRTAIVVDDGLATGATMRAAVLALRRLDPARVVVAVPVASRQAVEELGAIADACVAVATPSPFFGVGLWYRDFSQTTDDEVRDLLARGTDRSA
jgi:putative phosphoribosyl transferase